MKYRPPRSGYEESMALTVEVADMAALVAVLHDALGEFMDVKAADVTFSERHVIDDRNGWDTYYVLLNGQVVGFSDGTFPEQWHAGPGHTAECGCHYCR